MPTSRRSSHPYRRYRPVRSCSTLTLAAVPVIHPPHHARPYHGAEPDPRGHYVILELPLLKCVEHLAHVHKWRNLELGRHVKNTSAHHMNTFLDVQDDQIVVDKAIHA